MTHIAKIAVESTSLDFDGLYDYLIPDFMLDKIKIGYRVLVPFGHSSARRQGFVFSLQTVSEEAGKKKLKTIDSLADSEPLLSEKGIQLAEYIADRTFCTLFEGAKIQIPAGLCLNGKMTYAISSDFSDEKLEKLSEEEQELVRYVSKSSGFVSEDVLKRKFHLAGTSSLLKGLEKKGFFVSNRQTASVFEGRMHKTAILSEKGEDEDIFHSLTEKQKSVVQVLRETGSATVSEICYFTGVTASVVTALEQKGILTLHQIHKERKFSIYSRECGEKTPLILNQEQNTAYESLKKDLFSEKASCTLLFGVTGSGKTSVYTRLIDDAMEMGKGVIVTVPEISLTPQTLSLFYSRYGNQVAVFHSGLSAGERVDEWKKVKSGKARLAVGTRSAIFAPFEKIGLIVIDEEQEHTYKSERSPRYDAIDIAKYLCARDQALLLLTSATPSIGAYSAAKNGRYQLLTLKERFANAVLPEVEIIDVSESFSGSSTEISDRLKEAIQERLEKKEQILLFINRRGFYTFAACPSCKKVMTCPSCSISMTYHKANHRLMCHYCGYSEAYTTVCPFCGASTMQYSGSGTQRIEDELHNLFPDARILRMDADTTSTKNAHENKLREFAEGKYDIMLGTQMVTKGLDFPRVTLAGIVSADMGIYKDDYRSAERAFDLLTQVIGRSGRGQQKGVAMLQTISPENEVIRYASNQDYESFYAAEIENRRMMIYPPFCDICLIGFIAENEAAARAGAVFFLEQLRKFCKEEFSDQKLIVIGPNPSLIRKMGNKYRYRLMIKCKNSKRFRSLIRELLLCFMKEKNYKKVSIFADINPEANF